MPLTANGTAAAQVTFIFDHPNLQKGETYTFGLPSPSVQSVGMAIENGNSPWNACAWQNLEDSRCNWTCADGTCPGNMQTIAIERIMSGTTGTENVKARDNAARLAAYILHSNGLTADNLYTHTYWLHVKDGRTKPSDTANIDKWCTAPHTYKNCPLYIIPDWIGFKKLVDGYIKKLGGSSVVSGGTFMVRVLDPALNMLYFAAQHFTVCCKYFPFCCRLSEIHVV